MIRRLATLGAALFLAATPCLAQDCPAEVRQHCGGFRGSGGTDDFLLPGGQVLRSFPVVSVSGTGLRPSSANVVGNPLGRTRFQIAWRAGALSCLRYTVSYCRGPGN